MGFQALLVREDYYSILRNTLQRYYNQRFGEDIVVGYEPKAGASKLIMNPRLGMIFKPLPPRVLREYIYRNYNIRNNLVKNIAAKIFVFLSTHTYKMFTMPKVLYIYPSGIVNDETMIAYLNRSIRIFDFKERTTVSIQKETFTSKFFQNQLRYRINNTCDYIPPITAYGETWFEEAILEGKPLARETDSDNYDKGVRQTLIEIIKLASDTSENRNTQEYIKGISTSCSNLITVAKGSKGINTEDFATEYLSILIETLKKASVTVPLAASHGDLQAGNIWLDNGKPWIIDWETYSMRSIWFDTTTLLFGTRYYGGIKKLVSNLGDEGLKETMLQGQYCDWNVKQMVALFLLEDLSFYLEDMMELPEQGGKDSFDKYMEELSEINWQQVFTGTKYE